MSLSSYIHNLLNICIVDITKRKNKKKIYKKRKNSSYLRKFTYVIFNMDEGLNLDLK